MDRDWKPTKGAFARYGPSVLKPRDLPYPISVGYIREGKGLRVVPLNLVISTNSGSVCTGSGCLPRAKPVRVRPTWLAGPNFEVSIWRRVGSGLKRTSCLIFESELCVQTLRNESADGLIPPKRITRRMEVAHDAGIQAEQGLWFVSFRMIGEYARFLDWGLPES